MSEKIPSEKIPSEKIPSEMMADLFAASPAVREMIRFMREGILVVPRPWGTFAGIMEDDTWGQGNDSWCEAGPPWVQSGGDVWQPDEELLDFGGLLTKELVIDLAQMDARIIKGSVEERRWRIAVPKGRAEEARKLIIERKADYVKRVATTRKR